jgi:hypothetical protein
MCIHSQSLTFLHSHITAEPNERGVILQYQWNRSVESTSLIIHFTLQYSIINTIYMKQTSLDRWLIDFKHLTIAWNKVQGEVSILKQCNVYTAAPHTCIAEITQCTASSDHAIDWMTWDLIPVRTKCPDQPRCPDSLLFNGYLGLFHLG